MTTSSVKRQRAQIDMRTFARGVGATVRVPAGGIIFSKGEHGDCMYARLHVDDRRHAAVIDREGPRRVLARPIRGMSKAM